MKFKGKLPKDDANGVEQLSTEFVGNVRNEKLIPAIVLLGTEDVLVRHGEPIVFVADIEAVPEEQREYVRDLMGSFKAARTGQKTGAQPLDLPEVDD